MLLRTQGDYQVFWSKEHNREYYFHPATNATVWSLPQTVVSPPVAPSTPTLAPTPSPSPAPSVVTPTPAAISNHTRKPSDAELAKLFEELGRDGQNWSKLEQKEFVMLVETKKARFLAEQKGFEDVIVAANTKMAATQKKDKNYNAIQQSARAAKEGAIEEISNSRINRKEEELLLQKVMKYREEEQRRNPLVPPSTPTLAPSVTPPSVQRALSQVASSSTPHHSPTNSVDNSWLGVGPVSAAPRLSVSSSVALANPEALKYLHDRGGAGLLSSLGNSSPVLMTRAASLSTVTPLPLPASPAPSLQAPPGALRVQGDYHVYYSHEHKREYYFHLATQQTLWSLPASALSNPSTPPKLTTSVSLSTLSPSPTMFVQMPSPALSSSQSFPPVQTSSSPSSPTVSFPAANPVPAASFEATPRCDRPGCTKWAFKDGLCKPHSENPVADLTRTESGSGSPAVSPSPSPSLPKSLADQILAEKKKQAAKALAKQEAAKENNSNNNANNNYNNAPLSLPPSSNPRGRSSSSGNSGGGDAANSLAKQQDTNEKLHSNVNSSNNEIAEKDRPITSPPPSSSSDTNSGPSALAASIAAAKKKREEKEAAEKVERERVAAEKEAIKQAEKERKAHIAKVAEEKKLAEKVANDKIEAEKRAVIAAQKLLEEQKAAEKAEKAAKKELEKKLAEERANAEKERMFREATERLMAEKAKQLLAEQDEAADNEIMAKLTLDVQKSLGLDFLEKLHSLKRVTGSPASVAHLVRIMLQRSTPYRPGDRPSFWTAPSEKSTGFAPIARPSGGFTKPEPKPSPPPPVRETITKTAPPPPRKTTPPPSATPTTTTTTSAVLASSNGEKIVPKGNCIDPACDCVNFQPDAFRKDKCRNCFHNHSPAIMKARAEQEEANEAKRKLEQSEDNSIGKGRVEEVSDVKVENAKPLEEDNSKKREEESKVPQQVNKEQEETKKHETQKPEEVASSVVLEEKEINGALKMETQPKRDSLSGAEGKPERRRSAPPPPPVVIPPTIVVNPDTSTTTTSDTPPAVTESIEPIAPSADSEMLITVLKSNASGSWEGNQTPAKSSGNNYQEMDLSPLSSSIAALSEEERLLDEKMKELDRKLALLSSSDATTTPTEHSAIDANIATTSSTEISPAPTISTVSPATTEETPSAFIEQQASSDTPSLFDNTPPGLTQAVTHVEGEIADVSTIAPPSTSLAANAPDVPTIQTTAATAPYTVTETSVSPADVAENTIRRLSSAPLDSESAANSSVAKDDSVRFPSLDVAATTPPDSSIPDHNEGSSMGKIEGESIAATSTADNSIGALPTSANILEPKSENLGELSISEATMDVSPAIPERKPSRAGEEVTIAADATAITATPPAATPEDSTTSMNVGDVRALSSNEVADEHTPLPSHFLPRGSVGEAISAVGTANPPEAEPSGKPFASPSALVFASEGMVAADGVDDSHSASTPMAHALKKSPSSKRNAATAKKPFSFNTAVVEARSVEGYGDAPARVSYSAPSEAAKPPDRPRSTDGAGLPGNMMAEMMQRQKARAASADPASDRLAADLGKPQTENSLAIAGGAPISVNRKASVGVPVGGTAMMEEMKRKREANARPRAASAQPTPTGPAHVAPDFLEAAKNKNDAEAMKKKNDAKLPAPTDKS